MPPELKIFEPVIVFLTGLILGSFATALTWRGGRDVSWVTARSRCPSCQKALGFPDLIPLFSWLALCGRCRHCGAPIGRIYPLTELAVLAGCLGVYAVWGFTVPAFIIMAALPFLTALFIIDVRQMILPDDLQAVLAGLGLLFALSLIPRSPDGMLVWHLAGAPLYAGVIYGAGKLVSFLKKKEALGFGDVKFFAIAGLWLGAAALPCFMVASGLIGVIYGVVWRLRRTDRRFPFGPALISALYLCLLIGGKQTADFIFSL